MLRCWQVDPDEESRQRLRLIRGEVDAPMKAAPPAHTAQDELAEADGSTAAAAAAEPPLGGAAAVSAPEADGAAAAARPEEDSDEDLDGAIRPPMLSQNFGCKIASGRLPRDGGTIIIVCSQMHRHSAGKSSRETEQSLEHSRLAYNVV